MISRILNITPVIQEQMKPLAQKFFRMTGLQGDFRDDTFTVFWNELLRRNLSAMWVFWSDDRIVGTIGMTLSIGLFDGKSIAEEAFWFVDPDHRGLAGPRLFNVVEKWAEQIGVDRMTMACMDNVDPERVESFYRRKGFRKLQTMYVRDAA